MSHICSYDFYRMVLQEATPTELKATAGSRQELLQRADEIWTCDTLEKANSFIKSLPSPLSLANYVAGELELPSSPQTRFIDSFEPKTGSLLYQVPCTQEADIETAIGHAKTAFKTWSKTPRVERSRHLRRISVLLEDHRELFAVWESIDQGKTIDRARVEVDRAISNFS